MTSLLGEWEKVWASCDGEVATSPSCAQLLREHLLAHLVCPGRHTITSLLTTNGKQFADWSPDYSLYAKMRVRPQRLFRRIRTEIEAIGDPSQPLVVALDDTLLPKTGRSIPGTAYRKDPLGPPFQINLVWAQRMLQLSAAVLGPKGEFRMIPIGFEDASTPRKPAKSATEALWNAYREQFKQANLNTRAVRMLQALQLDRTPIGGDAPPLHAVVDGSFTNRKVLKNLPLNTTLIGRIRKDAHLSFLPEQQPAHGRRRVYGEDAPTPEELRKDPRAPWKKIWVYAKGKRIRVRVKTLGLLRWRVAGKDHDLCLVVIAPRRYRKRRSSRWLYRRPAYLICTDPQLPVKTLVQHYIWRWDIEVNHRDEKTLLGVGQAQVRNGNSVKLVPAVAVAAYSMLHLAAIKAYRWRAQPGVLPLPKWRDPKKKKRATTLDLINELRRELWASAIRPSHLTDFAGPHHGSTTSEKCMPSLYDALFYCTA